MTDYMLFGSICSLGFIAFLAVYECHQAQVRARAAELSAHEALLSARKLRDMIDNLKKSVSPACRETMAVSYTEGFSPRDSWSDDFHRTQVWLQKLGAEQRKRQLSWIERIWEWMKSVW